MSTKWFVEHNNKPQGPFTSAQLKQLASAGKIAPDTRIRMNEDGQWSLAEKVKGLFTETKVVDQDRAVISTPAPVQELRLQPPPVFIQQPPVAQTRPCPFCGEEIAMTAIKCRHCSEFLDGRPRENSIHAQQSAIHMTQVTNVTHIQKRFNPLVAAILSLLIPGLGQLYKGQPINGFVWFVIVLIGYIAFIIPGVVLHLCCIAGAAMGNPYR